MQQPDLLQGTLDMLILKTLSLGPLHGRTLRLRWQHSFARIHHMMRRRVD